MRGSVKLFTLFGINVKVHATFLLLPAFIGLSLFLTQGPMAALRGIILIFYIFGCVAFHELTHSLVARKFNTEVHDITLLPIGGVASMKKMPKKPKQEFLMAISGPMFNLALAAVIFYPIYLALGSSLEAMRLENIGFDSWKAMLLYMFWINPILAVFNLLPAFPMDGGRALRSFLAERMNYARATRIAVGLGHAFAIFFGLIGLMHPYGGGIILIIIAFFIYIAASQEEQQVNLSMALKNYRVADVINESYIMVKPDSRLSEVAELSLRTSQQDFPVEDKNSNLLGILDRRSLVSNLHQGNREALVKEVMQQEVITVRPQNSLVTAYTKMARNNTKVVVVLDKNKKVKGLLTLEDIARIYHLESGENT